jgi:hypothetical protein
MPGSLNHSTRDRASSRHLKNDRVSFNTAKQQF